MALVRRQPETERGMTRAGTWDPFEMMRELVHWDPFREMRLSPVGATGFIPGFEVKETKDSYVFKADLPGVKEADLDISLTGSRLTIAGKREEEKRNEGETFYTYERSYGAFSRSFTLPEGVDAEHVRADLKEGVLTVVVPKLPEVQPRRIEVKAEGQKAKA